MIDWPGRDPKGSLRNRGNAFVWARNLSQKRHPLGKTSPPAFARSEVTPPGTRASPETRPVKPPRTPRHVETFCSARHVLPFSQYVIVLEMAGTLDMAALGDVLGRVNRASPTPQGFSCLGARSRGAARAATTAG